MRDVSAGTHSVDEITIGLWCDLWASYR